MSLYITPAPLVFDPIRAATLYDVPNSPSAYDDEFIGPSLDPKWTAVTDAGSFDNVNGIDTYAGFSSGHRSSYNNYRPSWFMLQPATSGRVWVYQAVSLPSECFIWARCSFNVRYNALVNNDADVGLHLGQLSSGLPSVTNYLYAWLNESDVNTVQVQGGAIVSGVDSSAVTKNVGPQTVGTDTLSQPFEFIGIQKIGTAFHIFAGTGGGNWVFIKTVTYSGTIDILALSCIVASTAAPGNMIVGFDFVRVLTGRALP